MDRDRVTDVSAELSSALFSGLAREDQRACARGYLNGLLLGTGRRSVRTVASAANVPQQSLHHFITDSPWCSRSLRTRLTQWLESEYGIDAVVVRTVEIPKSGEHSAGVGQPVSTQTGRVVNRQLLVSAWLVSGPLAVPVEWVLVIPQPWQDDPGRCARAGIPPEARHEDLLTAIETAYRVTRSRLVHDAPLVLDTTDAGFGALRGRQVMTSVLGMSVPYLMKVPNSTPVLVRSKSAREMVQSIGWVARSAHHRLRPTVWTTWTESGPEVVQAAAASVCVGVPLGPGERPVASTLVFDRAQRGKTCSWLTNATDSDLETTLAMRSAVGRSRHQLALAKEQVGLLDYAGRSFEGLHRHLSMAAVAHAVSSEARSPVETVCGEAGAWVS